MLTMERPCRFRKISTEACHVQSVLLGKPCCGARTRSGNSCRAPAMLNGRCRMHGGPSPGAPKGNKNAFKHGLYMAGAIARRRKLSELMRAAKALARKR